MTKQESDELRGTVLRLLAENVTLEAENKVMKENILELSTVDKELRQNYYKLSVENQRLKEGKFTKEEVHNICHNLHGTVGPEEFADGCRKEMEKLYGFCPWSSSAELYIANAELVAALKGFMDTGLIETDGKTTDGRECNCTCRVHPELEHRIKLARELLLKLKIIQ